MCIDGHALRDLTYCFAMKTVPGFVLNVAIGIAAGMRYLHSRAVIYANLKPSTVLVDEFGTCKLSDFRYALRVPATEAEGGVRKRMGVRRA